MFSKACQYGIRATIYIAEQSLLGKKVSLKDVAKETDSPEAYTSKILQKLAKSKIINSEKGPTGGFLMDEEELKTIKLSTIVAAIDGDDIYSGCGLGLKNCNGKSPCPMHNHFKDVRNQLKIMLESTTIQSLAIDLNNGLSFLKRQ